MEKQYCENWCSALHPSCCREYSCNAICVNHEGFPSIARPEFHGKAILLKHAEFHLCQPPTSATYVFAQIHNKFNMISKSLETCIVLKY